jgi:hypothetical protein
VFVRGPSVKPLGIGQEIGVGLMGDNPRLDPIHFPHTFYSEPPRTPHFVWAKDGEVILQTTGMGQPASK